MEEDQDNVKLTAENRFFDGPQCLGRRGRYLSSISMRWLPDVQSESFVRIVAEQKRLYVIQVATLRLAGARRLNVSD